MVGRRCGGVSLVSFVITSYRARGCSVDCQDGRVRANECGVERPRGDDLELPTIIECERSFKCRFIVCPHDLANIPPVNPDTGKRACVLE